MHAKNTNLTRISRRHVLRGGAGLLALPWFESMGAGNTPAPPAKRFLGLYHPNGVNPYKWYPTAEGRNYEMPENLAMLKDFRDDMTVFSGLANFRTPVNAGHYGLSNFLTGCGNGAGRKFETTVSLDQYLAPHLCKDTRFNSLTLSYKRGVGSLSSEINTISFGARGNAIPAENSPQKVFERLFVEPSASGKERFSVLQADNRSILDSLRDDTTSLNRRLGKRDQARLDEYLTNLREVEQRIRRTETWLDVPRHPIDKQDAARFQAAVRHDYDLMMELIYLAFVSDSTRSITFAQMTEPGLYHGVSHWNKKPDELLPEMDKWDRTWIGGLETLCQRLKTTQEGDGTFLDHTVIVYGGGHGRRPHYSHDLPMLLIGGKALGFKHGSHLAFAPLPEEDGELVRNGNGSAEFAKARGDFKRTPLANMFVSVANAMGVPTESFADSTGPLNGLV